MFFNDNIMFFDYIVVGSGMGGLLSTLSTAKKGKVLLLTKKKLCSGATPLAQGGIAGVLSETDSFEKHIKDTLKAGAYHNQKKVVKYVVKKAPEAIKKLIGLGVHFDRTKTSLSLGLEGGHSQHRIAHIKDISGKVIEEALIKKVRSDKNITIWENTFAIDLMIENKTAKNLKHRALKGLIVLRGKKIFAISAKAVILATGGAGQVYSHTTNPLEASGDGIAIAHRAGVRIRNMEFIQFHPTAVSKKEKGCHFLLSEAMRGEGAILLNKYKKRFVNELLSRDKVSRAIHEEQKKGPVYLTFVNKSGARIRKRFPTIDEYVTKRCHRNLTHDLIEITPVAHYLCGGIEVNLRSETSLKNLFAVGEVACTGLHGANRLASNSLLEAAVFGSEIGQHVPMMGKPTSKKQILDQCKKQILDQRILKKYKMRKRSDPKLTKKIQEIMWQYVGIVRTEKGLKKAQKKLKKLEKKTKNTLETKNLLKIAEIITEQAFKRKKSLGCHWINS